MLGAPTVDYRQRQFLDKFIIASVPFRVALDFHKNVLNYVFAIRFR